MLNHIQHNYHVKGTVLFQEFAIYCAAVDIQAARLASPGGLLTYFDPVRFKVLLCFQQKESVSAANLEQSSLTGTVKADLIQYSPEFSPNDSLATYVVGVSIFSPTLKIVFRINP